MKSHLKVKLYTLTTEMTYIRRQEEKWKTKARLARQKEAAERAKIDGGTSNAVAYAEQNFWSQRYHRKDLKTIARTTHLAYGAMKGIPYSRMEYICYGAWHLMDEPAASFYKGYNCEGPDWEAIAETVERFSRDEPNKTEIMQRFGEWLADAKAWYAGNPQRIMEFNSEEAKANRAAQAAGRKAVRQQQRLLKAHPGSVAVEADAPDWAKAVPDEPEAA